MELLLSPVEKITSDSIGVSLGLHTSWSVSVAIGGGDVTNRAINWCKYPVSIERVLLIQRLLLQWWTLEAILGNASIADGTFRKVDVLLRLLALVELRYPNQNLCELEREDWIDLSVNSLFYTWNKVLHKRLNGETTEQYTLERLESPLGKHQMEKHVSVCKALFESYHQGNVTDGPEFEITIPAIKRALKPILLREFNAWETGANIGSIPFAIAHLLLADALKILSSDRTKQLLVYFEVVTELRAHDLVASFWVANPSARVNKYRTTGDADYLEARKEAGNVMSCANRAKTVLGIQLHKRLLDLESCSDSDFIFPWKNHAELARDYREIQTAIYIIFLSVMGKRGPSEIRTLRGIDITPPEPHTGRNALMRPSIDKTHSGLRQEQGVTNFIDKAFNTSLKLGYFDKTDTELPLFTTLPSKGQTHKLPSIVSRDRVFYNLRVYYKYFCKRTNSQLDFLIEDMHPQLSSHQFRHSFAEFALRKFDGNVEELIRQHFCHSHNHWWTKRYTADKLDSDAIDRMNRAYIQDLVPQILSDDEAMPDYVGAMALFIKKELGPSIQVLSPNETEEYIESFSLDFISITAHEYGWCLLHKNHLSTAKCKDSLDNPRPSTTNSKKCNSCVNFVASRKSHLAVQTQIAINHCEFLEQKTWSLPRLKRASAESLSSAQKLFPELKELLRTE